MQNPVDNATYRDLKKPLKTFVQLFIIYQRLNKDDIFIKHGSNQNSLKKDKMEKKPISEVNCADSRRIIISSFISLEKLVKLHLL